MELFVGVFEENKGITESIDQTSWSPKKQTKGLSIIDVPITDKDPYNTREKKKQFDTFLKGAQGAVHANNLEDMLMRLFSQFINPLVFKDYLDYVDYAEYAVKGDLDTQLKILRGNFERYSVFVDKYYVGLVTESDEKEIKDLEIRPGSIPYLAKVSHSLSHTQFWPKVEEGLKSAFSSGINTSYKKK